MILNKEEQFANLAEKHGIVLLYHAVSTAPTRNSRGIHMISPDIFEKHIVNLSEYFRFISLNEFIKLDDPSGFASITFDDGYRDVIKYSTPILARHGITASMFLNQVALEGNLNWRDKVRFIIENNLINCFLDTCHLPYTQGRFYRFSKHPANNSAEINLAFDQYLQGMEKTMYTEFPYITISELYQLSRTNHHFQFGNHGANHYVLSSLTNDQQYHEINSPVSQLSSLPNSRIVDIFSVPFGADRDINAFTVRLVQEAGYKSMLMSRQRLHTQIFTTSTPRYIERFMPRTEDIITEILQSCNIK